MNLKERLIHWSGVLQHPRYKDAPSVMLQAVDRLMALENMLRQFPGGLIEDSPQPATGTPQRYLMVRAEQYERWRDGADALLASSYPSSEPQP